jgi:hypothetical protein
MLVLAFGTSFGDASGSACEGAVWAGVFGSTLGDGFTDVVLLLELLLGDGGLVIFVPERTQIGTPIKTSEFSRLETQPSLPQASIAPLTAIRPSRPPLVST